MEENSDFEGLELAGATGYGTEPKKNSSQHQTSEAVDRKGRQPQSNESSKCRDKQKTKNHHTSLQECASSENGQKRCVGSKASKDDMPVKYMSTIPRYVQQIEKRQIVQEKALNFGVLDWNRLEKWKFNERMPVTCHIKAPRSKFISTTSTMPSFSRNSPSRKEPPFSVCPNSSPQLNEGTQKLREKFMKVQDFQVSPSSKTDDERKPLPAKVKSSDRSCPETNILDGRWKESDERTISEVKSFSELRDRLSMFDTASVQDSKGNATVNKEVNLSHCHCPAEQRSFSLLSQEHSVRRNCTDSWHFTDSRTSYDKQSAEANGSRLSNCSSYQELYSGELDIELPHSCPLPADDLKFLTVECPDEISPSLSKVQDSESNVLNLDFPVLVEPAKKMDLAEQPTTKGKHPSSSHRFSFSFARLSRTFSSKDSSGAAQLSSTNATRKSGPLSSETPAAIENGNNDKLSTSGRGRSSPLRRLLDPMMKPKSTLSAEVFHSSTGSSSSVSLKPMDNNELLSDRKHEATSFQALLQPIVKKGLPFFKLLVENSSDILAAAPKNIPASGKSDSSLIYAIYSVHEIKKKGGGWMNQGSRSKSHFNYNVVGQMKISNGNIPDFNEQKSTNLCTESVLYNVDSGQDSVKALEFCTSREIAAIVVRSPVDQCKEGRFKKHGLPGCNQITDSTIVILPDGIHSIPNQGGPSSLISRWKSGGACDCGGWDMGCKLQILANQDRSGNILSPSMFSPDSDRLDLFSQLRKQESKPIFSMAAFKDGLYSVEFDKSISLQAAFSISIAVITSRKYSEILETSSPSKADFSSEPMTRNDCTKARTRGHGQLPARYTSLPPTSPVERI